MADTVLVTGANGFIAKHVVAALLGAGYHVRGTARSEEKGAAAREALSAAGADVSGLSIVVADLLSDAAWPGAVDGCAAVFSIASPFPAAFPKDRTALLPEVRGGALRVLEAALAAGVPRLIHTSSIAAMAYRPDRPDPLPVNEQDWSDPDWDGCNAYVLSKTLAERALWDRVARADGAIEMVSINPGLVLGPLLDDHLDTSMGLLSQLLRREFPTVANLAWPVVDVRDLAALQVAALRTPGVAGRRLIAAGDTVSQAEMVRALRQEFPTRQAWPSTTAAPDVLMRLLAHVVPAAAAVREDFGIVPIARSTYVTELTGVHFRPARDTLIDAASSLIQRGLVD